MEKLTLSPFVGRSDGVKWKGQSFGTYDDNTISEGYLKETVKKTGDGDEDFVVEKKLVKYREYSRDKYIQDESRDVGILNVLKKVAISGVDLSEDNPYAAQPGYTDMTVFPESLGDVDRLYENALAAWKALPDEIKGKMSYEEFVKSPDATQKIMSYYQAKADKEAAVKKAQEEQGGND